MANPWNYADEAFAPIFVQEGGAGARRQPAPGVQPFPGDPMPRQRPVQREPAPRPRVVPQRPPQTTAPAQAPPTPPAPAVQELPPQAAMPPPAPPAAPEETRPEWNYADETFAPVFRPPPTQPGSKLGTARGNVIGDMIRGKVDPLNKDLPAFIDTEGAADVSTGRWLGAKGLAVRDESYADVLAAGIKHLNPVITKDANDYPIITYDGKDGQRISAYVNRPGLDLEDVSRGIYGALPFVASGGATALGLRATNAPLLLGRVPAQASVGVVTSGAQDAGATAMGSEQGFDGPKAIGAGVGGAIGETIAPMASALWRRFVTEPSLYNRATGQLTEKGAEAARAAGMKPAELPAQLQQEFARLLARSGNAKAASVAAETGDLGIPTTLGQRTKDVAQLTREQEMRDGVWGEAAARMMREFDDRQWKAMVNATMGEIEPGKPGMSLALNPARSPGDYAPGQIGAAVAERAQQGHKVLDKAASDMWRSVGKIEPTDKALAELPRYISNALGDLAPSEHDIALMPGTVAILKQVKAFMERQPPKAAVEGVTTGASIADLNRFRQVIGKRIGDMEKSTDKQAAGRIYNGLNEWIREMAEQNLLTATSADAATSAANMVAARGLTRNLHAMVEANGNKPGAAIVKKILETADSPEEVIRSLFVGPTAKSVKPGSIEAIKSIKQMAAALPGDEGLHLMNDLKLAYWLNIVRNPAGREGENIYNPQVMLRNLRVSADAQRSVWQTLYTPAEIAMRNRLIRALENGPTFHDWTIKPNSSRSGTTVGRMFTDMLGLLVGQNWARTIQQTVSSGAGMTRSSVNKALSQDLPARPPVLFGPAGAAAGSQSQQ